MGAWSRLRKAWRAGETGSFGAEIGGGLGREHEPGGNGADGEHENERQKHGLYGGNGGEDELDLEGPFAQGPGGDGRDQEREQRRGKTGKAEFEQLGAENAPAGGAERLVDDGEIFAPLLARGDGAREHGDADQKRDAGRGADRGHDLAQ